MKIKILTYPEKTKEEIADGEKQGYMIFSYPGSTRTEAIKKVREKLRKMGWEEKALLTGISQFKILEEK